MVRRDAFINKIRDLDYYFKTKQKRTTLWRKRGGTHYIAVPLADLLEDEFVLISLRQAGLPNAEILRFIGSAKS
jgi:hypothetical protein